MARGVVLGALRQIMSLVGMLAGLWAAWWISQWVGLHWQGARPAVVFGALHWLVAALGGLAIASLFQFWGLLLGGAVRETPIGGLDRAVGVAMGALWGVGFVAFCLWLALLVRQPHQVGDAAAGARCTAPLMSLGVRASARSSTWTPPAPWLNQTFRAALRRAQAHH